MQIIKGKEYKFKNYGSSQYIDNDSKTSDYSLIPTKK